MGGGKPRARATSRAHPDRPRHTCAPAPSPSFLRRQEPTHPNTLPISTPSPIHPSPLLADFRATPNFAVWWTTRPDRGDRPASPNLGVTRRSAFRGEVRWGVGRPERAPPVVPTPIAPPHLRTSCPLSSFMRTSPVIPAQAGIQASAGVDTRLGILTAQPSRCCTAARGSEPRHAPPVAQVPACAGMTEARTRPKQTRKANQ